MHQRHLGARDQERVASLLGLATLFLYSSFFLRFNVMAFRLAVSVFLVAGVGCGSTTKPVPKAEESPGVDDFATQVALIRQGETDAIFVETESVSDGDLSSLEGLGGLRTLILDGGRISDEGAKHLSRLTRIQHLRLRLSPVSDIGLAHIAKMIDLRILNLPHGEFTNHGIRELVRLTELHQLRLGSDKAGANVCDALSEIPSLRALHLIGIPIDDAGLLKLGSIAKLESLYIDDSKVTDSGAEALFEIRPDLHVHFNQKHHDLDPSKHP